MEALGTAGRIRIADPRSGLTSQGGENGLMRPSAGAFALAAGFRGGCRLGDLFDARESLIPGRGELAE